MDIDTVQEELKSRTRRAVICSHGCVHDHHRKSMGYVAVARLIMDLLTTRAR